MITPDCEHRSGRPAPLIRVRTMAAREASRRKSKRTRDYNNSQLIPHLREVERIIGRRLTSQEMLSPKFKASLKTYMAWAAMWKGE